MTLKEKLNEAYSNLETVKAAVESGEKTADDLQQAIEVVTEADKAVKAANDAAELIKGLNKPVEEKADKEEIEMDALKEFTAKAAEVNKDVKGWSVSAHVKAADTVVSSLQITDYDKTIVPAPARVAAASFFTGATISGNAITYFTQNAYEGVPAITAEGAKKPQNSTSFTSTTLPLSKIAAYIKETDEILWDNDFLADEVRNSLVYHLGAVEDSTIINAVATASGAQAVTLGENESLADGILGAIMAIKERSAYDASVVMLNPADFLTLMKAKDQRGQYLGGGYFTGAYGNGGYPGIPSSIWGIPVFTHADITAGTAVVAARQAVKVWRKGGMDVKLYEQNEDDAINNRVTLLAEERLACAVVDLNGVCKVS